jgi:ABC-2 type transport system ATP-binding protein
MTTPVFELDQVTKIYPGGWWNRAPRPALRGVSLRVEPGEVFGLVGPNRAGKTTLIKVLLTLCRPTSGQGRRFGQPLRDRSTLARVGYVHESHAFPTYLTAAAALEFYGALSLIAEPVLRARVPELLKLVGLADRSDEPIRRFSKGMRQRLAVAQALVNDPELLVLDEPGEGLDLEGRATLRKVIAERRARGGAVLLDFHRAAPGEARAMEQVLAGIYASVREACPA